MQIIIRKIEEKDTNNIIEWRNNNEVLSNFIDQKPLTKYIHLKWLKSRVETGEVAQFIITDLESKTDIGSVYLRDIDFKNKKAELGIFIGVNKYRGKGVGKKSIKLILDYGFSELKLNKIFLRVFKENVGAISAYRGIGFSEEGYFKQDVFVNGKYVDIIFMALIKSEWEECANVQVIQK